MLVTEIYILQWKLLGKKYSILLLKNNLQKFKQILQQKSLGKLNQNLITYLKSLICTTKENKKTLNVQKDVSVMGGGSTNWYLEGSINLHNQQQHHNDIYKISIMISSNINTISNICNTKHSS